MKIKFALLSFILVSTLSVSAFAKPLNVAKPVKATKKSNEISKGEQNAKTFSESLKKGEASVKMRTFFFDRSFDEGQSKKENALALTTGGIMKYTSMNYYGFSFGVAPYVSLRLGEFFSREEGKGTSNLGREGEDIFLIGEAFLQYNWRKTRVKFGRQQLSTPLIQNHDLRMLPSVYEAAVIQNQDLPQTKLELGYVDRYTGFGSKENAFLDAKTGKHGLIYAFAENQSIEGFSVRAQFVQALTASNKRQSYSYVDAKYEFPFGKKTYLKAQFGANAFQSDSMSTLLGAKLGSSFGRFSVAALIDKISTRSFQAFESGPMYSDWQQGYGSYEPSLAVGGQVLFEPTERMSLKFGYVNVASSTRLKIDDFMEYNIDAKYQIADWAKIRLRYSLKDQSVASEALRFDAVDSNGGREDRNDFRLIYYMQF